MAADTDLQIAWKAFYEAWMNGLDAVKKQARASERQRIRSVLGGDIAPDVLRAIADVLTNQAWSKRLRDAADLLDGDDDGH